MVISERTTTNRKLTEQARSLTAALRNQLSENLMMSNKTVKILRILDKANNRYYRRYYAIQAKTKDQAK